MVHPSRRNSSSSVSIVDRRSVWLGSAGPAGIALAEHSAANPTVADVADVIPVQHMIAGCSPTPVRFWAASCEPSLQIREVSLNMEFFTMPFIGFVMGFGFGVGCAFAVLYTIYIGGYRKAMEDSLREEKSERYLQLLPKVRAKLAKEPGASERGTG